MKILSLTRNASNQIIAEVLNCGKTIKVFAYSVDGLIDTIYHECKFVTKEDVKVDLQLNFSDFV